MTDYIANEADLDNPIHPEFWLQSDEAIDARIRGYHAESPLFFRPEQEIPPEVPLESGPGSWIVTQHADILEMSKNPQIFSSAAGVTVLDTPPEFLEFFGSMISMDDPRHARLRRIISPGFTPRMLARLEDSVQVVATEIIDSVCTSGKVDFVVDIAAALPLKIVCDLMGIPRSQFKFVFDQTNVILGASDPEYVTEGVDIVTAVLTAGMGLAELMKEVAESKKGGDGEDLTSILVNAELDDETLSPADLASFFILLVVAGNETTRNAISWGLHYLTQNPDQRAIWVNDFEAVAPTAIEEIVRLASPVTYMRRTATQDTILSGQKIAKGDKLSMFYSFANREEHLFEDAYRFDVLRDPNPHVGFGGPGPHFCMGAHLARREITVMYRELFKRLPDIHATGEPDKLLSAFIHGIKHLDAEFTPTAPSTS